MVTHVVLGLVLFGHMAAACAVPTSLCNVRYGGRRTLGHLDPRTKRSFSANSSLR